MMNKERERERREKQKRKGRRDAWCSFSLLLTCGIFFREYARWSRAIEDVLCIYTVVVLVLLLSSSSSSSFTWHARKKLWRRTFFGSSFNFFQLSSLIAISLRVIVAWIQSKKNTQQTNITTRFFSNFSRKRRWQTPPPLLLRKRRHPKPWPRCFLFSSSPFFPVSSFQSRCTESAVDLDFSASSPERRKTQKRKEEEEEEGRRR